MSQTRETYPSRSRNSLNKRISPCFLFCKRAFLRGITSRHRDTQSNSSVCLKITRDKWMDLMFSHSRRNHLKELIWYLGGGKLMMISYPSKNQAYPITRSYHQNKSWWTLNLIGSSTKNNKRHAKRMKYNKWSILAH